MTRAWIKNDEIQPLTGGWQVAVAAAGGATRPDELEALNWLPARVPGTAAGALQAAGCWNPEEGRDFDAEDWWFRTTFESEAAEPATEVMLHLDGIATICDVFLNGALVLTSESMFASHALEVSGEIGPVNELAIRCHALSPHLRLPRAPRARWRTQLVADGNLRFYRTMLLGRAPGFAPTPAAVGPWRPVWLERRRRLAVDTLSLRTRLEDETGVLSVRARLRMLDHSVPTAIAVELVGTSGEFRAPLRLVHDGLAVEGHGELAVPQVSRWWPHTHGTPSLHQVALVIEAGGESVRVEAGSVGFRELAPGPTPEHEIESDGLDLHLNGVEIFARGAVWTPTDPVGLAAEPAALRATLERVRAAGMNMLRLAGTSCYEGELFHDLCDELGILVWQDFMFANLDYPVNVASFRALVTSEAREVLERLGSRPSLVVVCGNSEVEQQVAMLGLDPSLGRGELFGELLPALVDEAAVDAVYVPSAPCGGDLPFRPDHGIANYYGVGGYLRPLTDARRSNIRFAAECLAFANVPDDEALADLGTVAASVLHHSRWKAGVPRDAGASWDFEDVRDHYLAELFATDPHKLRREDPQRYLELSRAVSGEVMAEVFGEWRRGASQCGGGLVLSLGDLRPGSGWGVLDHRGQPKTAYHHLRRALAPVAVWTTDEGLGGVDIHVANDRSTPFSGRLRVALYRDLELLVDEADEQLELPAHSSTRRGVEQLLGRFVDASWAYRFGPPAQDVIAVSLERTGEAASMPVSQSIRFPAGRPTALESPEELRLEATTSPESEGSLRLHIRSQRLAYGVRVRIPGFEPDDDAFCVEPGRGRVVLLHPGEPSATFTGGELVALNLRGRIPVTWTPSGPQE